MQVSRYPGVWFKHAIFLSSVAADMAPTEETPEGYVPWPEGAELGNEYARRLKDDVDAVLRVTSADTNPRSVEEGGGPGVELDFVRLIVGATAVAGGYVVWKEVAQDIRAAALRLRQLSRDHVVIDEAAALILAIDAVAAPNTFADLTLRFIAPLHRPDDDMLQDAGFMVGVELEGSIRVVVIDPDGAVLGVTPGPEGIDFGRLGL